MLSMIDSSICRTEAQVVGYILIFDIINCNNVTFPRQKMFWIFSLFSKQYAMQFIKSCIIYYVPIFVLSSVQAITLYPAYSILLSCELILLFCICIYYVLFLIFTSLHCLIMYFCLFFAYCLHSYLLLIL